MTKSIADWRTEFGMTLIMKLLHVKSKLALLSIALLSLFLGTGCRSVGPSGCPVLNHSSAQAGQCLSPSCHFIGGDAGYHETNWTALQPPCDWEDSVEYESIPYESVEYATEIP